MDVSNQEYHSSDDDENLEDLPLQLDNLLATITQLNERLALLTKKMEFPRGNVLDHVISMIGDEKDKRQAELGTLLVKNLETSKLKIFSGLKNEIEIPPYGNYRFSNEQRKVMLENICNIRDDKKHIGPGCSVLIDILSDHIQNMFFDFLQKAPKNTVKELLDVQKIDGKKTRNTRQDLAWTYFANIQAIFGVLTSISSLGFSWCAPVGRLASGRLSPESAMAQIIELLAQLEVTKDLAKFDSHESGKKFLVAIDLLIDVACQHMHSLFCPVSENPQYKGQFRRLFTRLTNLKKMTDRFDILISPAAQFFRNKVNKKLVHEYLKFLESFYKNIAPQLELLAKEFSPSINQLRLYYQALYQCLEYSVNPELKNQLLLEIETLCSKGQIDVNDVQQKELLFSSNLISLIDWQYQGILRESVGVIFCELLAISKPEKIQMDNCIGDLVNVTRTLGYQSFDQIENLFAKIELRKDKLENTDNYLFEVFKSVWKNFLSVGYSKGFAPLHDVMVDRLRRCHEQPDNLWERALAFRDGLMIFLTMINAPLKLQKEKLSEVKGTISTVASEIDDDVMQLFNEIYQIAELHSEAVTSSLSGIEALIGQCFLDLESNQLAAQEQAKLLKIQREIEANDFSKQLIDEEGKKARQKQRKAVHKKKAQNNKKREELIKQIKTAVVVEEAVISEETPLNAPQTVQKNIEKKAAIVPSMGDLLQNILQMIHNLPGVEGEDQVFRQHWRDAQLLNLHGYVIRLQARSKIKKFSPGLIFDQTDLVRQMVEATLEIVIAQYELLSGNKSLLREIGSDGHQLHVLVKKLLSGDPARKSPEQVRAVIWHLRKIPYQLSQANRCVNYLYSTADETNVLSPYAQTLTEYLLKVDDLRSAESNSSDLAATLLTLHKLQLNSAVYFVSNVIQSLIDPTHKELAALPSNKVIADALQCEVDPLIRYAQLSPRKSPVYEEISVNSTEEIPSIESYKNAEAALRHALVMIAIRILSPVEGVIDYRYRQHKRNIALKNVSNYLMRLKEILNLDRAKHPYNTVCGEWTLLRRAHKEITIASLWHGSFFSDGAHVVQSENLAYSNNPVFLIEVLKRHRPNAQLPKLGSWLGVVHSVLSYQNALRADKQENSESLALRSDLHRLFDLAVKKRELRGGFVESMPDGEVSVASISKQTLQYLNACEQDKVFPALVALLKTIKEGLPIVQSKMSAMM